MKYDCDEEVVSKKEKTHTTEHELTHRHPCFGMIGVYRTQGTKESLFGTELQLSNTIRIEVSQATVTQDLGCNWYFSEKNIVDLEMSPNQYAELISNPNTTGVPCTIRYRADKGTIAYRPIDTVTENVESVLYTKLDEFSDKADSDLQEIINILNKKGAINKSERGDIHTLASRLVSVLKRSVPFYRDSVIDAIDKTKVEAKAEVDSFLAHAINSAGVESLNNPELVKLLMKKDDV